MTKTLNEYIVAYKKQLEIGDIQKAYEGLVKYVLKVRSHLSKKVGNRFTFGNASQGYMDYTYFPFSDKFLKSKDLRFGLVLNHDKIRFELWLMGRNAEVQSRYWDILKSTKWNINRKERPKYSVLEIVLVENPDFNDCNILTQNIENKVICNVDEITDYIKNLKA